MTKPENKCVICGKPWKGKGIICNACMVKKMKRKS